MSSPFTGPAEPVYVEEKMYLKYISYLSSICHIMHSKILNENRSFLYDRQYFYRTAL
jgi:hypothetical protein